MSGLVSVLAKTLHQSSHQLGMEQSPFSSLKPRTVRPPWGPVSISSCFPPHSLCSYLTSRLLFTWTQQPRTNHASSGKLFTQMFSRLTSLSPSNFSSSDTFSIMFTLTTPWVLWVPAECSQGEAEAQGQGAEGQRGRGICFSNSFPALLPTIGFQFAVLKATVLVPWPFMISNNYALCMLHQVNWHSSSLKLGSLGLCWAPQTLLIPFKSSLRIKLFKYAICFLQRS